MTLKKNTDYYISDGDVVLRENPSAKSDPINHLIFGDWLQWLGVSKGTWEKIRCRGDEGWIRKNEFGPNRALEVNFLDIGQGDSCHIVTPDDRVIVVDAGKTDNAARFLSWRYNLRRRKVAGVDGVTDTTSGVKPPFHIEQAVISHPDLDHYFGFKYLFENQKLSFGRVFHNGIVERPISKADRQAVKTDKDMSIFHDLGRAFKPGNGQKYLIDLVRTDKEMRALEKKHTGTRKKYLSTIGEAIENPANKGLAFQSLSTADAFLPGYDAANDVTIAIQGPVAEDVKVKGKSQAALRTLGNEGVTKNGHSIVLQLRIGKLTMMLGGDLNTESEDFLLRHYCGVDVDVSELEKTVHHLHEKGDNLSAQEKQELAEAETAIDAIVTKARATFQVDVAKACHHGSHHFSESFLKAVNAIAVVISSGDGEAYSHPRPDALGAFGKYGRGGRPLLFSTEIARSTREFTPIFKYFERIKKYQEDLAAATSARDKARLTNEIENEKDRNVAVYGMITLRTDGEKVFIAQKVEEPSGNDRKWDIHELAFNDDRQEFVYVDRTKLH